jgi:hypothetical protein
METSGILSSIGAIGELFTDSPTNE